MIEVALKNKYLQFIDQNLIISRKTSSFWHANMFFLTISSMFSIFLLAMFYWLNVFWPSHFYNWFLLLMLRSSSFYFDSFMHHILFSTSESTEKTNIIILKKNLLYYSEQVIFIILICFIYRSRKTITMKIVFNKQKDPSDLMFINNMPIKIRQKHLTQQSKTVPSNFEKSP